VLKRLSFCVIGLVVVFVEEGKASIWLVYKSWRQCTLVELYGLVVTLIVGALALVPTDQFSGV
jgi:hypothetical protein